MRTLKRQPERGSRPFTRLVRAGLVAGLAASVVLPAYALLAGSLRSRPPFAAPRPGLYRLAATMDVVDHAPALWRGETTPLRRLSVEDQAFLAATARKMGLWPNRVEGQGLAASLRRRLEIAYGSPQGLKREMGQLGIDGSDLERLASQRAAIEALVEREVSRNAASPERVHAAYLYGGPWMSPDQVHVALGQPGRHGRISWTDLGWHAVGSVLRTPGGRTRVLSAMDRDGILPIGRGHAILRILGRRHGHRLSETLARAQIRRELLARARSHAVARLMAEPGQGMSLRSQFPRGA